jgi:hypothetical protein
VSPGFYPREEGENQFLRGRFINFVYKSTFEPFNTIFIDRPAE